MIESDQEFFYLVFLHLNFYKAPFIALSGLYPRHYWKEGLHSAKRDCFRTYNYNPITISSSPPSPWNSTMNWNGYTFLLADSSTRIDDYSRLRGNPCKRRAFSRYHVISRIFLIAPPSRSISPPYQPSMHTMLFFFSFYAHSCFHESPRLCSLDFARRSTVSNRRCRCDNEADSVEKNASCCECGFHCVHILRFCVKCCGVYEVCSRCWENFAHSLNRYTRKFDHFLRLYDIAL